MTTTLVERKSVVTAIKPQVVSAGSDRRYHSLDLWRGVACLLVVVYHATMQVVPNMRLEGGLAEGLVRLTGLGWIGVPMFFVISGYCIFATLEKSRERGEGLRTYFLRRFRRIFPPYWVALALSIPVVALGEWLSPGLFTQGYFTVAVPQSLSPLAWLGNGTLTESWRSLVTGGEEHFFLPHVWTLCYEEQFYAVAGLLLLLAPRRMFAAAGVVSLLVAVTMVAGKKLGFSLDGSFLDGRWLLFAAGIVAYYGVNHATPRGRTVLLVVLATALAARLAMSPLPFAIYLDRDLERVVAVAFALVLVALKPFDARLAGSNWLKPLGWCGGMCYSLYLVHALVTKGVGNAFARAGGDGAWFTLLVTLPLAVSLSIGLGWCFHVAVERRFLNSATGGSTLR